MRILLAWLTSWVRSPKLEGRQIDELDKLCEFISNEADSKNISLNDSARTRISKALAFYIQVVDLSYPKQPVPIHASGSQLHFFLSKPNWFLGKMTVGTVRKMMRQTKLSADELENAWQLYSDWRRETYGQPLMAETWRAFHHLLGYTKYIY